MVPLTEHRVQVLILRPQVMEAVMEQSQNSGGFTQEQLTDTNQTRTIYRNSDGHPLVITPDGNGNWVDFDGNTYRFVNNEDVYDQNDVDYYWHGEGADVYYMPVE